MNSFCPSCSSLLCLSGCNEGGTTSTENMRVVRGKPIASDSHCARVNFGGKWPIQGNLNSDTPYQGQNKRLGVLDWQKVNRTFARTIRNNLRAPHQPAPKYHTKGCSRSSVDSLGAQTLFFAALSHFLATNFLCDALALSHHR